MDFILPYESSVGDLEIQNLLYPKSEIVCNYFVSNTNDGVM